MQWWKVTKTKRPRKGKENSFCFIIVQFELIQVSVIHVFMSSVHALNSLVRLVTSLRRADFWSSVSVIREKLMIYRVALRYQRGLVYMT